MRRLIVLAILALCLLVEDVDNYRMYRKRDMRQKRVSREPPPPVPMTRRSSVKLEYIKQQLDHFDPTNKNSFNMRYYRNDEFYKRGGPIFIEIGAEWTITPDWLQGGLMYDLAKELGAQMYYTEHRYYGKSIPTKDLTLKSLQYLSVDQALADLAYFIEKVKQEPGKENSKVIVFGCSYGGAMATWFRQKYPNHVVGARSSSAPLIAKTNFKEYKEVVGEAIKTFGGKKCYQRIENAFKQAEELAAKGDWKKLKKTFKLCDSFDSNNQLDVWYFFAWLGYVFDGYVQHYEEGDLEDECKALLRGKGDDLEEFAKYFLGGDKQCNDITFDELIEYYSDTSINSEAAQDEDRQWTYQTCTEFGYFQTSDSYYQPFGSNFPVDLDYNKCAYFYNHDIFTPKQINTFINRTNSVYGGLNPAVKNVYFTHGSVDPWRTMGVQKDVNNDSPVDIIPGVAHCADLYSVHRNDSPEMKASKQRLKTLVNKWLK